MKKYLFFSILFLQILFVHAQEKKSANDYKFAFKAYSNVSALNSSNGTKGYSMGIPTFALQWKTGKNWQEIELLGITGSIGTYTNQLSEKQRISNNSFGAKYEYNWNFLKNPHRLTPSVGFGASMNMSSYNANSLTTSGNKYVSRSVAITPFITPRLMYNFTPRLLGEISMPIQVVTPSMSFTNTKTSNTNNRTSDFSTTGRVFMPRIGVGYRF